MEQLGGLFDRLKMLTALPATSGFEQGIARRLLEEMRPLADRVEVDPFGNVYGTIEGSGGPRVLLPAHSDSVGMIVSHIEENGYLRFDVVGSVPANLTYAQRVLICTPQGPRTGVVGSKPGHIAFRLEPDLGTTIPPVDALFIDVGASSRREVQRLGIEPGQQVTWDRDLAWLGDPSTGLVTGRSLDDKVGCLALLEAMRQLRDSGAAALRHGDLRRRGARGGGPARGDPGRRPDPAGSLHRDRRHRVPGGFRKRTRRPPRHGILRSREQSRGRAGPLGDGPGRLGSIWPLRPSGPDRALPRGRRTEEDPVPDRRQHADHHVGRGRGPVRRGGRAVPHHQDSLALHPRARRGVLAVGCGGDGGSGGGGARAIGPDSRFQFVDA